MSLNVDVIMNIVLNVQILQYIIVNMTFTNKMYKIYKKKIKKLQQKKQIKYDII